MFFKNFYSDLNIYPCVKAPPRFTVEPQDIYASDGGTVSFSCEADGEPAPVLSWYRNEILVRPSGRLNIFVGGLYILKSFTDLHKRKT